MNVNYPLILALAGMLFDALYGLFSKQYWKYRLASYNTEQFDSEVVSEFAERAVLIDSHYRFLGWWSVSVLGSVVQAYRVQWLQVALVILLLSLLVAWVYYLILPLPELTGWKRALPMYTRIVGYTASITIALLVGQ